MELLPNTDVLLDTLMVFIAVDGNEKQVAACLCTVGERDKTLRMLFEHYPTTERIEACQLIISRAGMVRYYRGWLTMKHMQKE